MIFWCLHLRQRSSLQEETASSDKRVVHRKTDCASEISSGEMFAGGEDIVRSLPPAKPRWSEVIVFWYLLLRQSRSSQEETASSGKRVGHRKIDSAGEINSGERIFAGGEGVVRGLTPAKPRWSEVIVLWCLLLRQNSPLPEETASSDKSIDHHKIDCAGEINSGERMFAGGEGVVRGLPPAKPQWS